MLFRSAPERILIIGDLTRSWHRFGPILEKQIQAQALIGGEIPTIVPVHEDGMARLRGTVALVLQKHFGPSANAQEETGVQRQQRAAR